MKVVVIMVMVVLAMIQLMAKPGHALDCSQVDPTLAPCMPCLTQGGEPSPACCAGLKLLRALAITQADRQTACQCVKNAASQNPELRPDVASALPQNCGVEIGIPIAADTNCAAVS